MHRGQFGGRIAKALLGHLQLVDRIDEAQFDILELIPQVRGVDTGGGGNDQEEAGCDPAGPECSGSGSVVGHHSGK